MTSSSRVGWIAVGVAGLLAASAATAASAASTGQAQATPRWHIVKSVKTGANDQEFTAVAPTGKTSAWAFDGLGFPTRATAWRLTGKTWTKMSGFPAMANEEVVTAGATSPSDVWAFTEVFGLEARVLHWNGDKWSVSATFNNGIDGASVQAANDVWVFNTPTPGQTGTGAGAWHYNGHTWKLTGNNIDGGSALSATDVWGFGGTYVEHWNGHHWTGTSVRALLPAAQRYGLNDPQVVAILALSDKNVYAVGNGNQEDDGGPMVVLHYNGHTWAKVAQGLDRFGPAEVSYDGDGGLWLALGTLNNSSVPTLVHYTRGKLIPATLPVNAATISVDSVARIPGTTQQLAGGFTHASNNLGLKVVAVILQYS
jgi:hypothetical protein